MALNWNASKTVAFQAIKNAEEDSDELSQYQQDLNVLIWALFVVKYPTDTWKITESNVEKIWDRIWVYYKLNDWTDDLMPLERMKEFIGYSCNSGQQTDLQFAKQMMRIAQEKCDDAKRIAARQTPPMHYPGDEVPIR